MKKIKKTLVAILIAICLLVLFGFRYSYVAKSEASSKIESVASDEGNNKEINDFLLNTRPLKNIDIFEKNYAILKAMINNGGVAMKKIRINEKAKMMIFQRTDLQEIIKLKSFRQNIKLEAIEDLNRYISVLADIIPTEYIYSEKDLLLRWKKLFNLDFQEVDNNNFKLNDYLTAFYFEIQGLKEMDMLLYFFIIDRELRCFKLEKQAEENEWEFIAMKNLPTDCDVNSKNLLLFVLCVCLHPHQFLSENTLSIDPGSVEFYH